MMEKERVGIDAWLPSHHVDDENFYGVDRSRSAQWLEVARLAPLPRWYRLRRWVAEHILRVPVE